MRRRCAGWSTFSSDAKSLADRRCSANFCHPSFLRRDASRATCPARLVGSEGSGGGVTVAVGGTLGGLSPVSPGGGSPCCSRLSSFAWRRLPTFRAHLSATLFLVDGVAGEVVARSAGRSGGRMEGAGDGGVLPVPASAGGVAVGGPAGGRVRPVTVGGPLAEGTGGATFICGFRGKNRVGLATSPFEPTWLVASRSKRHDGL